MPLCTPSGYATVVRYQCVENSMLRKDNFFSDYFPRNFQRCLEMPPRKKFVKTLLKIKIVFVRVKRRKYIFEYTMSLFFSLGKTCFLCNFVNRLMISSDCVLHSKKTVFKALKQGFPTGVLRKGDRGAAKFRIYFLFINVSLI
jgi:hypothetical protein